MYSKLRKCWLFKQEVLYLGHIISNKGISLDLAKIKLIKEWSIPKNAREVRSFLGLSWFYCKFIKNYYEIITSLTDLTRKDKQFRCTVK